MIRFTVLTICGVLLYSSLAVPGLETHVETGFNPLKPMVCNVAKTVDDGSLASGDVAFELNGFKNIQSRNFKTIDADHVEKPLRLKMNCSWRQSLYVCEWNEFYWVSIDPEKTWHTQAKDSSKPIVYASGLWLKGVKAEAPVRIECRQGL